MVRHWQYTLATLDQLRICNCLPQPEPNFNRLMTKMYRAEWLENRVVVCFVI